MKADGWEELYTAAALETDMEKLPKRIQAARASIEARIHGLQSENGGSPAERIAICDALTGLNRLSRKLERRHKESRRVLSITNKDYAASKWLSVKG